jgi:iron complex transport system substrate-binding protein
LPKRIATRSSLLLLLLSLIVCSCSSRTPAKQKEQRSAQKASAAITVIDAAGKKISLPSTPRRIVLVGFAPFIVLHMLYLFPESKERLVGRERKTPHTDRFLTLVDPGFDKKIALEANPGPEQIAALHPDLVIAKGRVEVPISRALAPLGIPVVHLGAEDPERFLADIEILGKLFENEPRAREITAYYRQKLKQVADAVSSVPKNERPTVLILEYNNRGEAVTVQVPNKGWFQTSQAKLAGGAPVWLDTALESDGWQLVGFEQIAAWQPQKIFVIAWYRLAGKDVFSTLQNDPKWKQLDAVKNGELYIFPQDSYGWDTAEPRWILGVLWLASRIYPDRFKELDMEAEVYGFFERLFGLSPATIEKEIMPQVKIDGRS